MSEENEDLPMSVDDYEQSDEENEVQSTPDALKQIQNAWLNEQFAPEILPQKMWLVESIIDQIDYFEEQLKRLEKNDIRFDIHTMELSRIRFIISSYCRIRLDKIERFVYDILDQEEQRGEADKYLTENELQFAREYKNSVENLFNNVALQNLANINVDWKRQAKSKPNLNSHVVMKVKKPALGVVVHDISDVYDVELEVGSQHIMPYRSIAHLVKDGSVQLI